MALYGFIMKGYIARWEAISSEDAFPSENNGSRDFLSQKHELAYYNIE
jgi:hypothetical protein